MEKTSMLCFLLMLLMYSKTDCHWLPRRAPLQRLSPPIDQDTSTPLCDSQFKLANRACALVPYKSVGPPSPPSHHYHRRHHRHHPRHGNGTVTPAEEECCRWLKEVDNVCVCGVLAHLPLFLSKPAHNYSVVVNDDCNVTFDCGSRSA